MNGIDSLLQASYSANPSIWWSCICVALVVGWAIYAIIHAPIKEDYTDDVEDE